MIFRVAGHETTASLLSFTFYLLSRFPEVKKKIIDELEEVLGTLKDDVIPSVDDLNKLEYMNAVLKEVLRLFPVGPATARVTEADEKLGPYDIPKGATVLVTFYGMKSQCSH